jgi:ATP-binding protein involved in chromosome partitioning
MPVTVKAIRDALNQVLDPEIGRPLAELGMIREVSIDGDRVTVGVDLTTPACPLRERIGADVEAAARAAGAASVTIDWGAKPLARAPLVEDDPCPDVHHIVLVASGKGGVGKSTVAANVALALARAGCRVGLLDADMYGPSIPTMFGIRDRPRPTGDGRIGPIERFGVKLMSIGFLTDDDKSAVIWRGPMLQAALLQFLKDVAWGALDYLVVDLPPGTGDVAITMAQRARATGAVIVTTSQAVALADVHKAVSMFRKLDIPILGVVENESYFVCDGCGKRHALFGTGGGQKIAAVAEAPLLGQIPLDVAVRECGDAGTPVVQADARGAIAEIFRTVAGRVADRASVVSATRGPALPLDREGAAARHLPVTR